MAKYLDIFTDYGFKKIFGEEANKDFLIDFLNSLLPPEAQIKDLYFKKTEQLPATQYGRKAIYDIYCENEKGEKFIVELQKSKQNYFIDRTLYYASFLINEQGVIGEWDFNLKAIYCIGLLDFKFNNNKNVKERGDVVHRHTIKNEHNERVYDKLNIIYLEMPNFKKTEKELETRLDKWLYFIKNLEDFDVIPEIFRDEKLFKKAMKKAELAKMSDLERDSYNASLKVYRDNNNTVNTAKEEGIKEGIKEGIEKGIKKGEANKEKYAVQKAKVKQIEMAKNCLEDGMSITKIAKLTGLTEEEIRNIIV